MAGRSWRAQPGHRRKLNHPDHDHEALECCDLSRSGSSSECFGERERICRAGREPECQYERFRGSGALGERERECVCGSSTLGKRIHGRCC
jgi:hypothetical protein